MLDDPAGREVMKRVASDENRHYLFYRGLADAAFEIDPSGDDARRRARGAYLRDARHRHHRLSRTTPRRIARAGIYDFNIHYEQILLPVVLRHWNIEARTGLTPEAELARDSTLERMERIGRAGRRMAPAAKRHRFRRSAPFRRQSPKRGASRGAFQRKTLRSSHPRPASSCGLFASAELWRDRGGGPRMHIPDGYLSPETCGAFGVAMVPMWTTAGRRVRKVVKNRYVPLVAIGAAYSFLVMMFNVPIPDGTTAHAVGGCAHCSRARTVGRSDRREHRAPDPGLVLR